MFFTVHIYNEVKLLLDERREFMKIGLVRHFRVDCSHKYLMTDEEFREWVGLYDCAAIMPEGMPVNTSDWEKCYCSDFHEQ
ncbi:hypothetical protein SPTER_40610 [Sporomusa termitida]|uniref:Uncharacterized protein n=1 Tax=Sporomusa termitida TaxID=2377 RepID=A0A517DZ55_9FIRM|nr:hypothetical protein SPTER_40610 [Sporomusa termitida]